MQQKNVYYQVLPVSIIQQQGHANTLRTTFDNFRNKLIRKVSQLTHDTTIQQLVNAINLGYKHELNPELQNLFISTGTTHLLSVSGLHTGAIYLLLIYLFKIIGIRGPKKELYLLPILWCYALLTGLSPSVIRASIILSFITLGKVFQRTYIPINSLAASAFLILLVQPSALYSLSFLLSYSAYTGILVLYPIFFRLPGTLPSWLSKIYATCCLTIAAQLPTLPISAFFFHTINLNGFLANLIAIPLVSLLLYISTISLLLPLCIGKIIFPCCQLLGQLLLHFLHFFAPYSINLQNLYPSGLTILFIYSSLITFGIYLVVRKRRWLRLLIVTLCFLLLNLVVTNYSLSSKQDIVLFHYNHRSCTLLNYKGHYIFLYPMEEEQILSPSYMKYNKLQPLPIKTYGFLSRDLYWNSPFLYKGQDTILIIGPSCPHYQSCTTLIITGNLAPEKIFFNSVSLSLPKTILLDGSNSKTTLQKWTIFSQTYHIACQNTYEHGAISYHLK